MVNSKKAVAPRIRMDLDERRKKLLELGIELFGKYTYDELSISSIAELAGISKGLLYHYFPTKRDFYVEAVRSAAADMLQLTQAAPGLSPQEALDHGLTAYFDYVEAHATAYSNLLRGGIGVDPEVNVILDEVRRTFVDRTLTQLNVRKPTAKQRLAVRGWVGSIEAVSLEWLEDKSLPRPELLKMLADQIRYIAVSGGLMPIGKAALAELGRLLK